MFFRAHSLCKNVYKSEEPSLQGTQSNASSREGLVLQRCKHTNAVRGIVMYKGTDRESQIMSKSCMHGGEESTVQITKQGGVSSTESISNEAGGGSSAWARHSIWWLPCLFTQVTTKRCRGRRPQNPSQDLPKRLQTGPWLRRWLPW